MPRTTRLLIPDQATVYHVMSRSALLDLPLGDSEKDHLTSLIKQLSRLYFTEILGFCCMGNHFHLLVRMLPEDTFREDYRWSGLGCHVQQGNSDGCLSLDFGLNEYGPLDNNEGENRGQAKYVKSWEENFSAGD